jgi:hypothetical protein
MSELAETPNIAVSYCPGCTPERDPVGEILAVRWCDAHQPRLGGFDDEKASVGTDSVFVPCDAEAATNRPWCELLHRTAKRAETRMRRENTPWPRD